MPRRVRAGPNSGNMKTNPNKRKQHSDKDTMRPEYDFSKGVRGVTAARFAQCTNIAVSPDARVKEVSVTDELITFHFVDGRVISVPLAWSWRLSEATPAQRNHFEIIGDGHGAHWPDVDEDISVEGMLHGVPARRLKKS